MSIRSVLIGGVLVIALAAMALVSLLGVLSINKTVLRIEQERVYHSLETASSLYHNSFDTISPYFERVSSRGSSGKLQIESAKDLSEERKHLGFLVLNACDAQGKPLAGTYFQKEVAVPVSDDPVLREALKGTVAYGTVALDRKRLMLEGGPALYSAVAMSTGKEDKQSKTDGALFQWFAGPVKNDNGRVIGLIYGGRPINHNYGFVDRIRDTLFGAELHEGKPLGTVTFFLGSIRVSTNVRLAEGRRAVGTRVSEEVQREVLERGRTWNDHAWVVDSWYLSAYEPLRDPSGKIIGMLYVGLLEAPFTEMRQQLLLQFLLPMGAMFALVLGGVVFVVRRISQPLSALQENTQLLAEGNWDIEISSSAAYSEVRDLAQAFQSMKKAIKERDESLRSKNEQLERTNRNYMTTLRFVTHELKAPLAAMQSFVDLLVRETLGEMPQQAQPVLVRIKRNCEELQDMVKNYLDLARAERGEMLAKKIEINLIEEVIKSSIAQVKPLFDSRRITLLSEVPKQITATADPELLRISVNNYLSNAAKYGREGGKASISVALDGREVTISVWNEGEGFSEEEGKQLFQKFSRLKNKNTSDKRGSGLGLYLCKQVMDLHNGSTWAESEPGAWARFCLKFPVDSE